MKKYHCTNKAKYKHKDRATTFVLHQYEKEGHLLGRVAPIHSLCAKSGKNHPKNKYKTIQEANKRGL